MQRFSAAFRLRTPGLPEFCREVQPPASLKGLDIPSRRAVFVPWKPSRRPVFDSPAWQRRPPVFSLRAERGGFRREARRCGIWVMSAIAEGKAKRKRMSRIPVGLAGARLVMDELL